MSTGEAGPLLNLSTQHLDYLRAALTAPTWALAAEQLGVTPSALSQGLGELERRLGVPLFERQGRRRVLRPEARPVAAYAERVLAQTRDLGHWAAQARSGRAGRLRLGMIDAAAVHHFPDAVRAFRQERPDLELHLTVAPSGTLLAALRRAELDLVVCVGPPSSLADVRVEPLLDEPLHLHSPDGRAGEPATWGPWVAFPAGSHTRSLVAAAVRARGAPFEVVAESHQPEVLREMVRLGMGWAVLPAPAGGAPDAGSSTRIDGPPLLWRSLVAARRIDGMASPALDALLERLSRPVPGAPAESADEPRPQA
jgi:DNA-binding transcriptional LysR family regulator